tara:strand:- start:1041 stop:1424 length:384 start_codon:yes stop_codon:yes gene_type:complete
MVTPAIFEAPSVNSVYQLIEARLGVNVAFKLTGTTSVGTADVQLVENNPGRTNLTIVNLSSNTVYLSPMSAASSSSGILLTASGGSLAMNYNDDLVLPTLEWHAIASASSSNVFVIEASILGGRRGG